MPINTLKAQQQKNGGIRKETTSGPPFGCREKKKTKIKEDKTSIPRLVANKMIEKMGREIKKNEKSRSLIIQMPAKH